MNANFGPLRVKLTRFSFLQNKIGWLPGAKSEGEWNENELHHFYVKFPKWLGKKRGSSCVIFLFLVVRFIRKMTPMSRVLQCQALPRL